MNANELRIGNLVEYFGIRELIAIKYHKIKLINESEKGNFIIEWCPIDSSSLKPIPLTEEILLKLGFQSEEFFCRIKNSRFSDALIHNDGIDINVHGVHLKHIKHLHELQNLYFSLTKNELIYEQNTTAINRYFKMQKRNCRC